MPRAWSRVVALVVACGAACTESRASLCEANADCGACDVCVDGACAPDPATPDCIRPDGANCGDVVNGDYETRTRFEAASVPYGASCVAEEQWRQCVNGELREWSGELQFEQCQPDPPLDCGATAHGAVAEQRVRYAAPAVLFDTACAQELQVRTCDDGSVSDWSGTFAFESCTVELPGARARVVKHPFRERFSTGGGAMGIEAADGFVYVANLEGDAVRVYDVSRTPVLEGTVTGSGPWFSNLEVDGTSLYVLSGGVLKVFDVSDPMNAVARGSVSLGLGFDLEARGSLVYVAHDADGLVIVDVSNPDLPVVVGRSDTVASGLGVAVMGDYAYLAGGQLGVRVIDVSDPATPNEVHAVDTTFANDVIAKHDRVYVSAYATAGFHLIDATTPTSAAVSAEWTDFTGPVNGFAVDASGDHVYLLAQGSGLQVLDVSAAPEVTLVGVFAVGRYPESAALLGQTAYVASRFDGVVVLDLSVPSLPPVEGLYRDARSGRAMSLIGDRAFVTMDSQGLGALDVSVPGTVSPVFGRTTSSTPNGVTADEAYVYVAVSELGLQLQALDNAFTQRSIDTPGEALDVALADGYAFVADGTAGLQVISVEDFATARVVGGYDTEGSAAAVVAAGRWIYLADGSAGLVVIDAIDPTLPARAGGVGLAASAVDLVVGDGYAYVAIGTAGLAVVDVREPAAPALVASMTGLGDVRELALQGSVVWTIDSRAAVFAVDVTAPLLPTLVGATDVPDLFATGVAIEVSGAGAFVLERLAGLYTFSLARPTLAPQRTTAAPAALLEYSLTWVNRSPGDDERVACAVSDGTCSVTSSSPAASTATVSWQLPAAAGLHELAVMVGNHHYFVTANDAVRVE